MKVNKRTSKELGSIVDWFEQHGSIFYTLGGLYLENGSQFEKVLQKTVLNVSKEKYWLKKSGEYKVWLVSLFLQVCRQADKTSILLDLECKYPPLYKELKQLLSNEKEALALTYLLPFTPDEVSAILGCSVAESQEFIHSGFHALRSQLVSTSSQHGCESYRGNYLSYLERRMERPVKVAFEMHVYHCPMCQEELSTFQELRFRLLEAGEQMRESKLELDWMKEIRDTIRNQEQIRVQRNKKLVMFALGLAVAIALLVGTEAVSGVFSKTYYTWTEDDEELLAFLKNDTGHMVNLVAENEGVKIRIKSVVADETQTLLFYEIEDTEGENQYVMSYGDGVSVMNEVVVMDTQLYQAYYPPNLDSTLNKKEKNVYYGKISLLPIKEDKANIKLKISSLLKIDRSLESEWSFGNDYKTGEWTFDVPVEKFPSKEYALSGETEVAGIPVRFDKLIVAPTTTLLQYGVKYQSIDPETTINSLTLGDLIVNNKNLKKNIYYNEFMRDQPDPEWISSQVAFEPISGVTPKDIRVTLGSVSLNVGKTQSVPIDPTETYPKTFEYAGSTISIDKLEIGNPTTLVLSDPQVKDRAYESIWFNLMGEDENTPLSSYGDVEQVMVDKKGVVLDENKINYSNLTERDQLRYFVTKQILQIEGNQIVPNRLDIIGYQTTEYLDKEINVKITDRKSPKK